MFKRTDFEVYKQLTEFPFLVTNVGTLSFCVFQAFFWNTEMPERATIIEQEI